MHRSPAIVVVVLLVLTVSTDAVPTRAGSMGLALTMATASAMQAMWVRPVFTNAVESQNAAITGNVLTVEVVSVTRATTVLAAVRCVAAMDSALLDNACVMPAISGNIVSQNAVAMERAAQ